MDKTYNINKQVGTFGLCCVIISALAILSCRAACSVLSLLRAVWRWLKTKHNFTPGDDEDPVLLTGAQYLGFVLLSVAAVFVISIRF